MSTPAAAAELPLAAAPQQPATPSVDRETYRRLADRARLLSWVSLAYMTMEGTIAIFAGVVAGSIALIGFGIDSDGRRELV